MPRPLWLHSDGGLLIAVGDYVLTEDVNVDLGLFFFFFAKSDYTDEASLGLEVTSVHLKAKQISFFLKVSVGENAARYTQKIEMVDPSGLDQE